MKRYNNLYEQIISIENLNLADQNARKGKSAQTGVRSHDKSREQNIELLHLLLKQRKYKTSAYTTFTVFEPKQRIVSRLPYFPDRITHHAILNVLEPIFTKLFTNETYSCIKGKGIHGLERDLKRALLDVSVTQYCLKLDIRKFYPSIDHQVLKDLLRKKFKDEDLLWLLGEIIDSAAGLPIGNYTSQYFANYYLTDFDHWIKQEQQVKHYFRYLDDMVILSGSKAELHRLLHEIRAYLGSKLKLEVKSTYQVFPVDVRGIDVIGYRFFHTHTLLRKTIKKNFARMLARRPNTASLAAYYGWAKHCDSKHLLKKLLNDITIQRIKDRKTNARHSRRKDQHEPNPQPGNQSAQVRDCRFEV